MDLHTFFVLKRQKKYDIDEHLIYMKPGAINEEKLIKMDKDRCQTCPTSSKWKW